MTSSSYGFAMADALIALIITSLFSSALLVIGHTTLRATDSAKARLQAALLARALIETDDLQQNEGETTFEDMTYVWTRKTVPASSRSQSARYIPLFEVEVNISWAGYQTPQNLRLVTHKLRRPS